MRKSDLYQFVLIGSGIIATTLFGVFLHRELFPEYKIYQDDYIELEKFRSSITGEAPPAFQTGVKQIIIPTQDNGPPTIDRCTTCHVALDIPYFSPTKIVRDQNGQIVFDANGVPEKIPNEEYIWAQLDKKIGEDPQDAEKLSALKRAHVDGNTYDVKKVLSMHPLIGKETRPFEFHPVNEYGCVSCHSGNGRSVTTMRAHGPIFDEQYEPEYEGPKKIFLEPDPLNDPLFAKSYNDKPGHELIFQTTPLLIGSLIESKCVQCHTTTPPFEKSQTAIDALTKNFHHGQELFISQACYACHRIAGFSRGGVGPELTKEGSTAYTWFIKKKLMWPQGDTPTSTMPNEKLDWKELEALLTFVLAQQGENRALSGTEYKVSVQEWEKGRKMPWEKTTTPAQIRDLNYAMTVFATEGCAACHRLKGFESNVGFHIENENPKPDVKTLFKEHEWFSTLFPEEISGSDIVSAIDSNAALIDQHIVDDVRKNSLLEEIGRSHPDEIEAFYSNFRYASRAKDHDYNQRINSENDPAAKKKLTAEHHAWKARVKRILMIYIQEYGLGRLIGPRPNWSGVFRSDEWLMEHFKNPSAHSPQSIMPVFPFDDTKFLALTYMLDTLSVRNRNHVQQVWNTLGFSPERAVNILCSQCHGSYLEGNGPVSEWIYPIPKNLRNSEFLRNLTREEAIRSITHGVKGTPMPPWGEVATDKHQDSIPVLNADQISAIVDWLFSSLPGGEVIKETKDVPKWQYSPDDVLREVHQENSDTAMADVFDVQPNGHFIKEKYYTKENIHQGKAFFELNCAACHGVEADGTGARAEYLQEAKPRMLTNLDWLNMHDDMYLLRSIKYGMPGTAMTPWGDLTTSEQRLQLVMFIRNLTDEQQNRDALLSTLYQTFETAQHMIELARVHHYAAYGDIRKQYQDIRKQREEVLAKLKEGKSTPEEAAALYQQELELEQQVNDHGSKDAFYAKLIAQVRQEAGYYKDAGSLLIGKEPAPGMFEAYLKLIGVNKNRYSLQEGKLNFISSDNNAIGRIGKEIVDATDKKIQELEKEKGIVEGKLPTAARTEELSHLATEISSFTKLKNTLLSDLDKAEKLGQSQLQLYNDLQEKK